MPTTRYRRQFSAGSRPTPDPYDKFLDLEGFYRKHTARDATCLFRTISEQLYDNQEYHEQIRKDCVNYLIKHRDQYEHLTPFNFNEYTCQMAKPTTYGTFLELRAIGYMYKRNILLYQPYDLGMWLVKEPEYTDTFRIFFAPEKHFDSVFTKPFIVKAAFCQCTWPIIFFFRHKIHFGQMVMFSVFVVFSRNCSYLLWIIVQECVQIARRGIFGWSDAAWGHQWLCHWKLRWRVVHKSYCPRWRSKVSIG